MSYIEAFVIQIEGFVLSIVIRSLQVDPSRLRNLLEFSELLSGRSRVRTAVWSTWHCRCCFNSKGRFDLKVTQESGSKRIWLLSEVYHLLLVVLESQNSSWTWATWNFVIDPRRVVSLQCELLHWFVSPLTCHIAFPLTLENQPKLSQSLLLHLSFPLFAHKLEDLLPRSDKLSPTSNAFESFFWFNVFSYKVGLLPSWKKNVRKLGTTENHAFGLSRDLESSKPWDHNLS